MSTPTERPAIVNWRRDWAQRLLDGTQSWPTYGSEEWNALALDDPRRLAACVAAAEIYTRDRFDDSDEWVRRELAILSLDLRQLEDWGWS